MSDYIPQVDTIRKTSKLFGISEYGLRRLVKSGKVASIRIGTRYLVNQDSLERLLNEGDVPQEVENEQVQADKY